MPPIAEEPLPAYQETASQAADGEHSCSIRATSSNSIIPERKYFYPSDVTKHLAPKSGAKYKEVDYGTIGRDDLLDNNPIEVMKFMLTHVSDKPRLKIKVRGYHRETHAFTTTDGQGGTTTTTSNRKVTDFAFSIPCDNLIGSNWTQMESRGAPTIKDVIVSFTKSSKPVRELVMEKTIGWDFNRIRGQIIGAVHAAGYGGNVDVQFKFTDNLVKVRANSFWNRMASDLLLWPLFFIYCPVKHLCLKKYIASKLVALYPTVSQEMIMQLYASDIANYVAKRKFLSIPMKTVDTEQLLLTSGFSQ